MGVLVKETLDFIVQMLTDRERKTPTSFTEEMRNLNRDAKTGQKD